jgi:MtrB/PioB family decaheme-associated outer membrane protein
MSTAGTARLVLAAVLLLWAADRASAQTSIFGLKIEGEVELGGRVYLDRPEEDERAKLEEYRDLDEQPFGAFRVRLFRPDESYQVQLGGAKIGQDDQEFFLSSERTGAWRFDFGWDQTPHVLSTTGRLLATEPSPGVFTLPTPRPALSAHNAAPRRDEIGTRWDTARLGFVLAPRPDWDVLLEYTRIKKDGERPFGMSFGSPGGNFYEILEPIDHTVHDVRLRGTWSGPGWVLQGGYTLSVFENGETRVLADNPCAGVGACAGDAAGPARGQSSLAPDNMAHTVSVAGALTLPMRSRVAANAAYSLRLQDETFLPHTVNPAIRSDTLTLPASSLDGMVGTFLFNVNASTRPLPPLTVSARYRLFDLDDMTDELVFPGHVVNDRTLVREPRRAGRYEYLKQNADLDARWRFGAPLALTVGAGWERWDRNEHREVANSNEYLGKAALDVTPADWVLVRLSYRPSFRRIDDYDTFAHLEHTVVEEDPGPDARAQGQSVLLRKFDEGERDRQRVDLLLQLTPTELVTASVTGGYRMDDYIDSALGLQEAEAWSAGFDLTLVPLEWLSLSAGYVFEEISHQMRSRSREVVGTETLDFPDFDWVSDNVDKVHTLYAGLKATVIPKVLDWLVNVSYAKATGEIDTRNPTAPRSGTGAQRSNATAKPFPDFEDSLLRLETALRYRFWQVWTLTLGYAFEKFEQDDFRTDGLNPFVPGTTSIFLGNDLKDYTAHIVAAVLGYRF